MGSPRAGGACRLQRGAVISGVILLGKKSLSDEVVLGRAETFRCGMAHGFRRHIP